MIRKRDWNRQSCRGNFGKLGKEVSSVPFLPPQGKIHSWHQEPCFLAPSRKKKIKEPQLILESVGQSFFLPVVTYF